MKRHARVLMPLTFAAVFAANPLAAQEGPCRQALALGLDVSGSVDAREYRLQLDGLALALQSPEVRTALLTSPDTPVEVLVYEWSGLDDQSLLVDWTRIETEADIRILQETLRQTRRGERSPGTALGPAMAYAAAQLQRRAGCWKLTLDISGDGKANAGTQPADMRAVLADQNITVNALVIGADAPGIGDLRQEEIAELSAYFRNNVIVGTDAFVQTALGYEAYADAMARKLKRELQTVAVSSVAPQDDHRMAHISTRR